MKNVLRSGFRKTFFYSSRQIRRRWRTYVSVFVTSVVLLTLVMTALELFQSYYLGSVERASTGTHHIAFLDQLYDYSEEIAENRTVKSAYAVPSTSKLASSVDSSTPGKVVVETDGIDSLLGVRYVWGHAPGDGEIAVSLDLYRSVNYLTAGEVNDLFFKATDMTYHPLTVSGIFTISGVGSGYVFVTQKTADLIDRETGAAVKFDNYIQVKHATERYAAKTADSLYTSLRMIPTESQQRRDAARGVQSLVNRYADYLNLTYIENQERYAATPVSLYVLPVILIAALILASFMANWSAAHAPEFGILSAIGANRAHLCAIAAGQILVITLIAAPPVVLASGMLANVRLSLRLQRSVGGGGLFPLRPVGDAHRGGCPVRASLDLLHLPRHRAADCGDAVRPDLRLLPRKAPLCPRVVRPPCPNAGSGRRTCDPRESQANPLRARPGGGDVPRVDAARRAGPAPLRLPGRRQRGALSPECPCGHGDLGALGHGSLDERERQCRRFPRR